MPGYYRLAPLVPSFLIKAYMKRVASKEGLGPLWWIKHNDEEKIKIFWGGREKYNQIKGWEEFETLNLSKATPHKLKND